MGSIKKHKFGYIGLILILTLVLLFIGFVIYFAYVDISGGSCKSLLGLQIECLSPFILQYTLITLFQYTWPIIFVAIAFLIVELINSDTKKPTAKAGRSASRQK